MRLEGTNTRFGTKVQYYFCALRTGGRSLASSQASVRRSSASPENSHKWDKCRVVTRPDDHPRAQGSPRANAGGSHHAHRLHSAFLLASRWAFVLTTQKNRPKAARWGRSLVSGEQPEAFFFYGVRYANPCGVRFTGDFVNIPRVLPIIPAGACTVAAHSPRLSPPTVVDHRGAVRPHRAQEKEAKDL